MATFTADTRVQVLIKRETPQGRIDTALYYPLARFQAKTDTEVQADIEARVAVEVANIEAAKTAPRIEPTREELQAQKVALEEQVAEINVRLAKVRGSSS